MEGEVVGREKKLNQSNWFWKTQRQHETGTLVHFGLRGHAALRAYYNRGSMEVPASNYEGKVDVGILYTSCLQDQI